MTFQAHPRAGAAHLAVGFDTPEGPRCGAADIGLRGPNDGRLRSP